MEDLLGDDVRLLFVGINPGLRSEAVNAHFAKPGNRFWPAVAQAGILDRVVDARDGMTPEDRLAVHQARFGITNIVARASARADEVSRDELRAGAARLERLVAEMAPTVVAVLGLVAYRTAFDRRDAVAGEQHQPLAGAALWVLPNPSGLNAHETVATLAAAYRRPAAAAGLRLHGAPADTVYNVVTKGTGSARRHGVRRGS